MATFSPLDPAQEDALHATRLLSFEDKLYKRLARRLLAADTPLGPDGRVSTKPKGQEPAEHSVDGGADAHEQEHALANWRTGTILEFAGFESNLSRVQFLLGSNALERERYAIEKQRIIDTAQAVRENNAQLRIQLAEAKEALEVRKAYDKLAEQITSNRALKPRDEQQAAIEKLHNEIADLERECGEYARTWTERREQFGKIVDEGTNMLRLIRDEKEEAERQEGMEGVDEAAATSRPPSRGSTPKPGDDHATPRLDASRQPSSLRVPDASVSSPSARNSGTGTPLRVGEDEAMHHDTAAEDEDTLQDTLEEGEAQDSDHGDKMEIG